MPVKKISKPNRVKAQKNRVAPQTEHDEPIAPSVLKAKKLDITEDLDGLIAREEKPEEESPVEDPEEEAGDELSLDSEEINPFGDKWEE